MVAKYTVLSNIISDASDNCLCIYIQESLSILKRFIVFLYTLSAHNRICYPAAINFTLVNPGNVCVQDEIL